MATVVSRPDACLMLRVLIWISVLWLPVPAFAGSSLSGVATGAIHSCVIDNGQVKCWGANNSGQLGDGTTTNRGTPVTASDISNAVALETGYYHTCAIEGGQIKCWGSNGFGQLGDNSTTQRVTPVTVSGINNASALAAGFSHTCVIDGGQVKCWGSNGYGQLGDGTTTQRWAPVTVSGIANASVLSAGDQHTCAIDGGQIKCWGWNGWGQLGDGTTTDRNAPVAVSGTANVTATMLVGGNNFTCAILGDQLKCWGKNDTGQLGDGTTIQRTTPVTVSGIGTASTPPAALAAGYGYACAIDTGQVKCWGANNHGQLGDGTTTNRTEPVTVSGISTASAIAAGGAHTCALDGEQVKCWGANSALQVGDGSTTDRSAPVAITGGTLTPPPTEPTPVNPEQPVAPPPETQTEYSFPTGVIPEAAVQTVASGTLGSVTLNVTLNLSLLFPTGLFSGQGQFAAGYNVYVAALVPSGRMGLPTTTWFMLPSPSTGSSWTQFAFPMAAYLANVAQSAVVAIDILQNMDMTQLLDTEFYIGYGLSDVEMLAAGRYRGVYIAR